MLAQYVTAFAVTVVVLIAVAIFMAVKGLPSLSGRLFTRFVLAMALWSGCEGVAITLTDPVAAMRWWRVAYLGVILIPPLYYHFLASALNVTGWLRQAVRYHYVLVVFFVATLPTPWFMTGATPTLSFRAFVDPGPLYYPFIAWWMTLSALSLWVLYRAQRQAHGASRVRLQYFWLGTLAGFLGGAPNFLPVFDLELTPWMPFGTYGVALCALTIAYALVNVRPRDVRVALAHGFVLASIYGVVIGVPLWLARHQRALLERWWGGDWWLAPFIAGLLLASAGPFVYQQLKRRTEARWLESQQGYQGTLLQASRGMTRIREPQRLRQLIVALVTRSARLRHAGLFLRDRRQEHYPLATQRQYRGIPSGGQLPNETTVVQRLRQSQRPIVTDELRLRSHHPPAIARTNEQLFLQLEQLDIAAVVPGFIKQELFGFLTLGPKRSGQPFTTEDLEVFSTLAHQAALAIENANSFEELQQAQAQLFQAQKMGTLGQMASGMSHQIHNRLTVLSLAAQNARINALPHLEELLHKIVGLPLDVYRALDELRRLYQVIEDESARGSQIVRGLLDYSRPSAQRESLAVRPIVQKAIEMLEYKHQVTELNIQDDIADSLPAITGSRSQLQDAFFNLLDNACDAIKERQRQLVQNTPLTTAPTFRGEIKIRATLIQQPPRDMVQITFADNGMGMNAEELSQLFIPFFTTKATSVKGTGLGLFIIQKIIESHGGRVRASSKPGEGSVFIVELPVAA